MSKTPPPLRPRTASRPGLRPAPPVAPPPPVFDSGDDENERTIIDPGSGLVALAQDADSGPGAKLVFARGPRSGEEIALIPGENTLGRQGENTIVIPDLSVSRRHSAIRSEGGRYWVRDLGSGNGTSVNGEKIEGEVELRPGDHVSLGDTEVILEVEAEKTRAIARPPPEAFEPPARARPPGRAEAPGRAGPPGRALPPGRAGPPGRPPAREVEDEGPDETGRFEIDPHASTKRRKRILVLLAATMLVAVVTTVAVLQAKDGEGKRNQEALERARIEKVLAQVTGATEAGKDAARGNDFKKAAEAFQTAIDVGGDDLASNQRQDLDTKLQFAKKEAQYQALLEASKLAAGKGNLGEAVKALRQVPEESIFFDQVKPLEVTIKARIPERLDAGNKALSAKSLDEARLAAEDVLAVEPGNAPATALLKKIQEAGEPQVQRLNVPRAARPQDPTDQIVEVFKVGRLDESISAAGECPDPRCKQLREKLVLFRTALRGVENDGSSAEKAVAILRTLPGGTSTPYMQQLSGRGATTLLKRGSDAFAAGDYPKAFQAFRKASELDPNNAVAKRHLQTLRSKASEIFTQAYVDKTMDADKARKGFEMVMQLVAPNDELYQKAQKHLRSLGD